MGAVAAAQAVVELGHDAAPDRGAELAERAGPLRDRHAEQRLARLAQLGPLRNEPQPIEVHVGAAEDGRQAGVSRAGPLHPGAQAGDRERAGRLHD